MGGQRHGPPVIFLKNRLQSLIRTLVCWASWLGSARQIHDAVSAYPSPGIAASSDGPLCRKKYGVDAQVAVDTVQVWADNVVGLPRVETGAGRR